MTRADYHKSKIYTGMRAGTSDFYFNIEHVRKIIQEYTNTYGDLVSVVSSTLHYKNGNEPGAEITMLYNSARSISEQRNRIQYLSTKLLIGLQQEMITYEVADEVYSFNKDSITERFVINGKEISI